MTLLTVSAARSLASREPLRQLVELVLQAQKFSRARAACARARLRADGYHLPRPHRPPWRRCRASVSSSCSSSLRGSSCCTPLGPMWMALYPNTSSAQMRDTSPAACAACTWHRSLRNCTVPASPSEPMRRSAPLLQAPARRVSGAVTRAASRVHRPARMSRPGAGRDRACCLQDRWPSADA